MKNILKMISRSLVAVGLIFSLAALAVTNGPVTYAALDKTSVEDGLTQVNGNGTGKDAAAFTDTLQNVINLLLFLVGAIAVLMIVVGGIRYVTSAGDQNAVKSARDTVLYSAVGLVIALMSFALVNFILNKVG